MGNERRYELRLYDRTLVEFAICDSPFGPEVVIEDYDDAAGHLMPCNISMDADGLWNWLETRSILAIVRAAYSKVLRACPLDIRCPQ